jgi:hypothetical protein
MAYKDPFLNESQTQRYHQLQTNSHIFNQQNIATRSFSNKIEPGKEQDQKMTKLIGMALSRKQISDTYHHDAYPYFMRS